MTRCGDGADVEWFLGIGDVLGGGDGERDEYNCKSPRNNQ